MSADDPTSSRRSKAFDELDRILEQFEDAWRNGERPDLALFLKALYADRDTLLLELLLTDLELRLRAGQAARSEDYLQSYPDLATRPQDLVRLIRREKELRSRLEPDLTEQEFVQRFPQF